ncbi:MAG: D-alanyl-D-alanine carboxypeptidase/D-alanyl-D-alanine endopeptidase [Blastocatellia bacterium]
MRLKSTLICLLLLMMPGAGLVSAQDRGPTTTEEIRQSIDQLLNQPNLADARWGVLIKSLDGRVIYGRDIRQTFMPASNMKLYTTAAALDQFGPGARIRTSLYAGKRPGRNGVLSGDLILYGRGAPNLSPRFLEPTARKYNELIPAKKIPAIEEFADRVQSLGIRVITGNVIGDDSYFAGDLLGPGWEWDDAQYYYGAEVSALTVNDNSIRLLVTPGRRAGEQPQISLLPETGYVKIVNRATTEAGGETRIGIERGLNSNTIEVSGKMVRGGAVRQIDVAIHNPALYAATMLREALLRRGVRVLGGVKRMDAPARQVEPFDETKLYELAGIESEPLSEMIRVVNKESQNLHAELLLRQLGRVALPGDAETKTTDDYGRPLPVITRGNAVRRQFLERAGIDVQSLSLRDGSGLARQNLVTPAATVRLLEFMARHQHSQIFTESLGIAGIDGTLERRMRETSVSGNLRAKTGTLSYVNALSGYMKTRGGVSLIVSLMGNNHVGPGRDVTSVMDRICVLLADYSGAVE